MKIIQYRSIIINLKQPEIYSVSDSCMLLAKNVYNASLFLLHNLISSYTYNKEIKSYTLKDNLHSNQTETLILFNQAISKLNQERLSKYKTKLEHYKNSENKTDKEPKKPRLLMVLLSNLNKSISVQDFQSIVLDKTLLEQTLKLKEKINVNNINVKDNHIDYTKIPSNISQYSLHKAVNDISIYYKSLMAYYKDKLNKDDKFTGFPQLPKYLDKNERLTLEIHHSYFTQKGTLFKINPEKHSLYHDFYKQQESKISVKDIEFFNQFNLKESLLIEIDKRLNKKVNKENNVKDNIKKKINYSLQTIRFVPQRISNKGKNKYPLKIEVIIEIEQEINDHSPIALLINFYNENKEKYKSPKLSYHELKDSIKQKVILEFINSNKLTYLAGGDLGQNNLFTLALTKGKNQIYSGNKINRYLTKLNIQQDTLKSSIFESNLPQALYEKVKYNQKITEQNKDIFKHNESYNLSEEYKIEKLDKLPLSIEELKLIKQANSKVYSNTKYNKLLVEMENYKNNILHKLSDNIIQHCIRNNIQCLVVGKNEYWKQEVNLSKETNRLFMTIPHSKLIELLQYKAFAQGLLFITTEESYTSKSSFLHNDPLPIYNKSNEIKGNINKLKEKESNVEAENNHSHSEIKNNKHSSKQSKIKSLYNFSGTRNGHEYQLKKPVEKINKVNDSLIKKYELIHADINGAFNMLRKIFRDFKYNNKISINYELNKVITSNYHKKKIY